MDPYNGGYYDYDTADTGFLGQDNEDRCAVEISAAITSLLVTSCHVISRPSLIQQQLSINIHCFVSSRALQL